MPLVKAAYINELYKLSKKKKTTVCAVLSLLFVVIAAIIVFCINSLSGIRITGSSEFSVLMLSVLNYTLIPLFTAFICIDVFGGEFADNTIKQTLTGPASRYKIFIAKILAISTFIIADLLFIMTTSFFASFLINGTTMNIVKILTAYLVSFLPMLVFALAVIVISNTAKGTTSAFMFSVLLFLVFNGLEIVFSGYKSFFFTFAFDWYRLFMGNYINFNKIIRIFFILSGYAIMLFGIGYYLFEKREI